MKLFIALLLPVLTWAQYAASSSGSTLANALMDSKPAWQISSGPPTALACTAGKDFAFDSVGLASYDCTVTGNPGTWVKHQAPLGFTPANVANNLSDLISVSSARTNLGLGTAATGTLGVSANNVVQLTAATKLPAVDGSLLTNLPATGITTFYLNVPVGLCISSVAGYGWNVPAINAPAVTCVNTGTTNFGVMQFLAGTTNESAQTHFELPPDWTSTINFEVGYRSSDSTHTAVMSITTVCVGSGAPDNPVFNGAQTITITPAAASARTLTSLTSMTTTGCSAGNELFVNIAVTTNSLTSTLDIISTRFTIVR